jgi:tRNA threonylcarbamoyladenosine biosynthesis protein TsaE
MGMKVFLPDEAATISLAEKLCAVAKAGDVLLLSGPLGAGKSTFARAFIRCLVGESALDVPSPSFTLVQSYESARAEIWHYDLWRLEGPAALEELGWDEAMNGLTLVEWPERLGALEPAVALRIRFEIAAAGRGCDIQGEARWLDVL